MSKGKKKTNKRTVMLLAVLAAILLLGGALAFLLLYEGDEGAETSSITPTVTAKFLITDKTQEDVKSFTVQNPAGTYTITGQGEDYTVSSFVNATGETITVPSNVVFNSAAVEFVVSSLFTATMNQVIEGGADNLTLYGLQNPAAKVDVSYKDGATASYSIGSAAPDGTNYYVYNPQTKEVGLVPTSSLANVLSAKEDFVDKTLVPTKEDDTIVVTKAVLGGTVRPEQIVIDAFTAEELAEAADKSLAPSGYKITAPKQWDADTSKTVAITDELWAAQADGVVSIAPTEQQLQETGLAEPFSTLSMTFGGKTVELKLGNKNADGLYYCTTSLNNAVMLVSADKMGWAEFQAFDLYYKLVVVPNIKTVSAVTVEFDGKQNRFVLTHDEEDNLTVTMGGKEINDEVFRSYYQLVISAKGEYEAGEIPEGAPVQMKFTYEYVDKSKPSTVVEFVRLNDRRSAIITDGDIGFAVRSLYIDKVKSALDQVLAGEKVIVTW